MSGREELFDLRRHLPQLAGDGWRRVVRSGLEELLSLRQVRRLEEELWERVQHGDSPFEAFRLLVGYDLLEKRVCKSIPSSGPVVVLANHPFGGADAVALPELCLRVRDEVKVLANREALELRGLAPHLLPLEILGGRQTRMANVRVLREALLHLRAGGLLVVFPAGAVSYWQWEAARVEDPPWPEHVARLVGQAEAPVLPVRFEGRNPAWWQLLARLDPHLRTGLLPRAFLAMRGETVRCAAGPLISPGDWPAEAAVRNRFLRRAVEQII